MAKYVPKPPAFLTPQMMAMGGVCQAAINKGAVAAVTSVYSAVTNGKYSYTVTGPETVSTSINGLPRTGARIGIEGPWVFGMETGSEQFPKSGSSRGALRRAIGAA